MSTLYFGTPDGERHVDIDDGNPLHQPRSSDSVSTLDEAWSAMEESRAEGWAFDGLVPYPRAGEGWLARGKTLGACRCCGRGRVEYAHGFGASPVAALLSLSKQEKWRTTHPIAPGQVEAGLG